MLKKLSVVAMAAVVTAGVLTSGCAKKGDVKDAEALCKQSAEASVEMAMGMHPNIPKDMLKKAAEEGAKGCMATFSTLDDAEKNVRYKQAADILKKCQGKKSKEFLDCAQAASGEKSEPAQAPAGHEAMPAPGQEGMPAGHEGMPAPTQEAPAKEAPAK